MPSVPVGTPNPRATTHRSCPPRRPRARAWPPALIVAALTFACYSATLLPGLDFGDTAAYQSAVGDWRLTPRQAYPLYYAIANTIFAVTGGEPAHSLNLTSALAGAAACGALVWVASALTGSVAGRASGPASLLGASYTFWSQAIIGEVYTLHVLLDLARAGRAGSGGTGARRFPAWRVIFGLYALGFGNHLMMVLLAPALVALIVLTPGGPRQVFSARGVGLAVACAALGASQYAVERRVPLAGRRPRAIAGRRRPHVLVRRHQVRLAIDDGAWASTRRR